MARCWRPQTGQLIIPVAHNAGYFWPRRGLLKKRGTVRVVIGPPISAEGRDPREINEETQGWIEAQVRELAPDGQVPIRTQTSRFITASAFFSMNSRRGST